MTDPEKQILTSLRCLTKSAGKKWIRAEMQQLIEDETLNEHERIETTQRNKLQQNHYDRLS
jgi:predicted secreted protein